MGNCCDIYQKPRESYLATNSKLCPPLMKCANPSAIPVPWPDTAWEQFKVSDGIQNNFAQLYRQLPMQIFYPHMQIRYLLGSPDRSLHNMFTETWGTGWHVRQLLFKTVKMVSLYLGFSHSFRESLKNSTVWFCFTCWNISSIQLVITGLCGMFATQS